MPNEELIDNLGLDLGFLNELQPATEEHPAEPIEVEVFWMNREEAEWIRDALNKQNELFKQACLAVNKEPMRSQVYAELRARRLLADRVKAHVLTLGPSVREI